MMLIRKILLLLIVYTTSAVTQISTYSNAQFLPLNTSSKIVDLFSMNSSQSCVCQCLTNFQCLTANYFGINQTCSLFSVELDKTLLKLVPRIMSAIVYTLGNRSTLSTTIATTTTTTGCSSLYPTRSGYSTSLGPTSVAVGDVNGDSKLDVIITSTANNIKIFLNHGHSSFVSSISYSTGNLPNLVAVGDINSDNASDIIVGYSLGTYIDIFFNIGNGSFLPRRSYGNMSSACSLSLADFNIDKKPDIVVADCNASMIYVLINKGNGTFSNQIGYSTGTSSFPRSVVTADINGDNAIDILVANYLSKNVGIFLNKGNGTFSNQVTYPTSNDSPNTIVVGDLNGDFIPDIVTIFSATNYVGIQLNAGNGTFPNIVRWINSAQQTPMAAAIADVNGDNANDIIVPYYDSSRINLFFNDGNGGVPTGSSYFINWGPVAVAVADMDGRNKTDIIVIFQNASAVYIMYHC